MGGHTRQPVGPEHGEAGAGLRGASAVFGDALVDSFVLLANGIYCQCAVAAGAKGEVYLFDTGTEQLDSNLQ